MNKVIPVEDVLAAIDKVTSVLDYTEVTDTAQYIREELIRELHLNGSDGEEEHSSQPTKNTGKA